MNGRFRVFLSGCAAIALLAALAATPQALAAAPQNRAGECLTPEAADGHEPVCNPFLASTAWSTPHRGSYSQGSSPLPAPRPGDSVEWQDLSFGAQIPVILQMSDPYPDGRRTVWFSTVSAPEAHTVYKLDYDTGQVIDSASINDEGGSPRPVPSTSGVYNLLDRDNHLITIRENGFAVYGDVQPDLRTSPIRLLRNFNLPRRALCRPNDRIIGITMTYTGQVAFATTQGMVGVLPREPRRMTDANLRVASINGERCADPAVSDAQLEENSNSISADEDGGVYAVSTKAMYRFDLRRGRLGRTWRAAYSTGAGAGGGTLSSGSGSTPDVVGTDPGDDKLIAITDGQGLMHLTLFWRDRIPRNWRGLPGRSRRMACEFPVTFGDPNATQSISEQSVLTRGYSFVVVNNALTLDRAFALIPPTLRPLSAFSGNVPGNGPVGIERIDWDPRTRTCRSVWSNRTTSIPNAIPTMSTESGLVYGVGVRGTIWGLEGIDFRTGRPRLWVPTTPLLNDNSFFAATTIGPQGDVWVGGSGGINVFRGPSRPAPRFACKDLDPPRSRVATRGRLRSRLAPERAVIRGRARDRACGLPSNRSLRRVEVAIARRVRRGCRFLSSRGSLERRSRPCRQRRFLAARLGQRGGRFVRFALRRRVALPPGRYLIVSRALDRNGGIERARRGRVRTVRVPPR